MISSSRSRSFSPARLGLLIVLLFAVLMARLWRNRNPGPPATSAEAEQRAKDQPENVEAQLDWATALHRLRRDDEAQAVFQHVAQLAPRDARPLNALAMLALEQRRPEAALEYVRASLNVAPNDADIWRYEGFLLQKASKLGDAAQAFRAATTINPKDAVSWRQLGVIDFAVNQTAAAINDLQKAVQIDPSHLETLDLLGDDTLSIGKVADARAAYEQALKLDPADADAKLGIARIELLLGPSPVELERLRGQINAIIAAKPSAAAALALGQCDLLERRYDDAITELRRALKMNKHLEIAHTYLAQAYAATGRRADARMEAEAYAAAGSRATALLRSAPQ